MNIGVGIDRGQTLKMDQLAEHKQGSQPCYQVSRGIAVHRLVVVGHTRSLLVVALEAVRTNLR